MKQHARLVLGTQVVLIDQSQINQNVGSYSEESILRELRMSH